LEGVAASPGGGELLPVHNVHKRMRWFVAEVIGRLGVMAEKRARNKLRVCVNRSK